MRHRAGLSRQRSRLASSRLIVFSSSRRMPPPGWSTPAHKLNSTAVQDSQEHGFGAASRRTADGREPLPVPEPPVPTVGHMPPLVKSVALRLKAHVAGKAERVGRTVADRAVQTALVFAPFPSLASHRPARSHRIRVLPQQGKRNIRRLWAYHRQHDHIARPELRRRHPFCPSIIPQQLCPIVREVTRLFHPCVVDVVHAVCGTHARKAGERAASGTASSGQTGGGCILCSAS